jgi:hypothetical protein
VRAFLAALAAGAIAGCGAGSEDERAGTVAREFYAAVAAKDGARACAHLSESTATELEKEEMSPCEKAVIELKLSGSSVERSTVYVTAAMVELRGGDHVFLDRTAQGWKVSAAGCKPQPGEEQPEDCEVES